jgi:predicted double-glycine peptidase
MFQAFRIDSQAFYESLILPQFADLTTPGMPFRGSLGEFTLMDNVPSSRPIIDIRGTQNILQRRDASCDIIYKRVLGSTVRKITTDEVYAATQQCRNEFYQGCLKDWRNNDPLFGDKILPFFMKAVNSDLASNAYFGDTARIAAVTDAWSTNVYDGIFKWYKFYIASNVIPASQTIAIADGTDYITTPASAYNLIKAMYEKQSLLMRNTQRGKLAYYVSQEIADGYQDYLISIGLQAQGYTLVTNGINQLSYKGVPIIVEPLWTPIITQIKGSAGYAAVLTIQNNFVFATDSKYGEGPDGNTALEVWYETKDMMWYYRYFVKAGTQIALPEYSVVAISSWT